MEHVNPEAEVVVDDDLEYEKLFDEFADEGKEQVAADTPVEEASTETDEDAPTNQVPDDGGDTPPDAQGSGVQNVEEDDSKWIDKLPEEFREQAKALYHQRESDAGRVASLRADKASLSSRLNELEAREAARASVTQGSGPSNAAQPETTELPDDLKEFAEKYPELSSNIAALVAHERAAFQQEVDARVKPLQEELAYSKATKNKESFDARAAEILKTDETGVTVQDVTSSPAYTQWVQTQPRAIRSMAQSTTDVDEALYILERFTEYAHAEMAKEEAAQTPPPEEPAPEPTPSNKEKLAANVVPSSRSADVQSDGGNRDYEDWFNHYAEK